MNLFLRISFQESLFENLFQESFSFKIRVQSYAENLKQPNIFSLFFVFVLFCVNFSEEIYYVFLLYHLVLCYVN